MADNFMLKAILSAVDKMSPALKTVAQNARNTRKYLADVGHAAGGLSTTIGMGALGAGILGGLSAVGIKEAIVGFTEYAEEMKKAAMATGMTTDEVQRMKYVAGQSGVAFESLVDGVGKLNKNLGEVSVGGAPELASLLQHLGIATRDANGHLRGGAELLPKLAEAFKNNTNPILQSRMGMAAFGKSWKEILPLLMEGSEGIEKSLSRFGKIKGVIPAEDLQAAKEFGDQLEDVHQVTKGFGFTIAKELIPTLSPLVEDFIQWAAANKKVIAGEIKQFVQGLVAGLKSFDWKGFFASIQSIVHALGSFVDMVGGARNALILLVLVMNANAIMSAFALIAALGRMSVFLAGVGFEAVAASVKMLGFAESTAAAGAMLKAGLLTLAKSAGLLAAAGAVGYAIGTAIYDNFISGTKLADWIGEQVARILAFFGNDEAKAALQTTQQASASSDVLASSQRVGGEININFSNAPAGMRVDKADGKGGVNVNANVGYRSYAMGGA